jgi:hypothetical protein
MPAGLLNGDADSLKAATEFFKSEFPKDTPLALISSKRDSIARPEDLKRLFVVATEAREVRAAWVHEVAGPADRLPAELHFWCRCNNGMNLITDVVCSGEHHGCPARVQCTMRQAHRVTCMHPVPTTIFAAALPLQLLLLQDEDVALFSIDGNHFGYENELDLPSRINFDGAKVKLGPISFGLGWADQPFRCLVNVVNKVIVPGFEWLQYKAYFLSPILVSVML